MENFNITVAGNILKRISDDIPSYKLAIIELIKNSYDANANYVKIMYSKESMKLQIIDDGKGMTSNDLEMFLKLGTSNKKYGVKNNKGRYIQGSKGIGGFSCFKLGKKVNIFTKELNNECTRISLNYDEILAKNNIADYEIQSFESDEIKNQGTCIEIELNHDSIKFLDDIFDNNEYLDLKYQISDDDFNVEIFIEDRRINIVDNYIADENLIWKIEYDSNTNEFIFINKDVVFKEQKNIIKKNFDNLSINLELNGYTFENSPNVKSGISGFYKNKRNDLQVRIYVNDSLIYNNDLFDLNILASKKTNEILRQLCGNLKIYVDYGDDKHMLDFTADRSNFQDSVIASEIKTAIEEINKYIQKTSRDKQKIVIDQIDKDNKNNTLNNSKYKSLIYRIDDENFQLFKKKKAYIIKNSDFNIEHKNNKYGKIPNNNKEKTVLNIGKTNNNKPKNNNITNFANEQKICIVLKKCNIEVGTLNSVDLIDNIDYIIDSDGNTIKTHTELEEKIKLTDINGKKIERHITSENINNTNEINYTFKCKDGRVISEPININISQEITKISSTKQKETSKFNVTELEKCEFKNLGATVEYFKLLDKLSKNCEFLPIVQSATRTVVDLAVDELIISYNETKNRNEGFKLKSSYKNETGEFKPSNNLNSNYKNFVGFTKSLDKNEIKEKYFKNKSSSIITKMQNINFKEDAVSQLNLFTHSSIVFGDSSEFDSFASNLIYFLVFIDYSVTLCKDTH